MRAFSEVPFTLLMRPGKMGLGSAYKAALAVTRGDFVVLMDADLSHHPQHIPEMIRKQQDTGCDIVSGTRYSLGGGVAGWGFKRILISRVANFGAQLLLRPRGSDLTGSFRLYRADVLKSILPDMSTKGYTFQMEILVRASRLGLKIEQVPIVFVDRLYGESKLGGQEFINYAMGLLQLFWWV
ncbi:MAG: hypothetical protein KVP17_004133 [Porospora cf. gigantea B]|uniref:uncharacterized protein n=2 Tax=Porospora cf. gigantea B TaxID=2853592 RepID=UPI00357186F8|nr:MAG: hypothetical protein KVP17_004133 [Porospora cf. gigantea B]